MVNINNYFIHSWQLFQYRLIFIAYASQKTGGNYHQNKIRGSNKGIRKGKNDIKETSGPGKVYKNFLFKTKINKLLKLLPKKVSLKTILFKIKKNGLYYWFPISSAPRSLQGAWLLVINIVICKLCKVRVKFWYIRVIEIIFSSRMSTGRGVRSILKQYFYMSFLSDILE